MGCGVCPAVCGMSPNPWDVGLTHTGTSVHPPAHGAPEPHGRISPLHGQIPPAMPPYARQDPALSLLPVTGLNPE